MLCSWVGREILGSEQGRCVSYVVAALVLMSQCQRGIDQSKYLRQWTYAGRPAFDGRLRAAAVIVMGDFLGVGAIF